MSAGAVADQIAISTVDPSLVAIVTLCLTGLIFPFVMYFFKKNERLHEETRSKVSEHALTLGIHEVRLISLEEWRRLQNPAYVPAPHAPTASTVNN